MQASAYISPFLICLGKAFFMSIGYMLGICQVHIVQHIPAFSPHGYRAECA